MQQLSLFYNFHVQSIHCERFALTYSSSYFIAAARPSMSSTDMSSSDIFRSIFLCNEQARFYKFIVGDKNVDMVKALAAFLEATHPDFIPRYSTLSDRAILHYMAKQAIHIEPFFLSNLGTNSYDVTLGPNYFRAQRPEHKGGIYTIYSQGSNDWVWGRPQEAILASEYFSDIGAEAMENILPTDRVIWIGPGETLLCHTNEMIGGTELPDRSAAITTSMHCRSSFGRSFIEVCKCFPENVRLLTRRGFKFVAYITTNDEIATYNASTCAIEYHRPTVVIKKSGTHSMVKVEQKYEDYKLFGSAHDATNHVNLATTSDHEWFAQMGTKEKSSEKIYFSHEHGKEKAYAKCSASSLLLGLEENEKTASFRVLTAATGGISNFTPENQLPFVALLRLDTQDKIDAFLTFYGYWLGDGTLEPCGHISCTPTKSTDKVFIQRLFDRLHFVAGEDYVIYDRFQGKSLRFEIKNQQWNEYLCEEYSFKYNLKTKNSPHRLPEASENGIESYYWNAAEMRRTRSAKWFYSWAFQLNPRCLRLVIEGLLMADGDTVSKNRIYTSCIRFRDELMRILLHAGYSPYFVRYRKADTVVNTPLNHSQRTPVTSTVDGWAVFLGQGTRANLRKARDVSTFEFTGDVYCVTVPNHLVFAQTACLEAGKIVSCSKTVIIGQCAGLGDVGFNSFWTMEITNISQHFEIPLLVGHRIAQIQFNVTDSILRDGKQSYGVNGKYQHGSDIEKNRADFTPQDMLAKLWKDREVLFKMLAQN